MYYYIYACIYAEPASAYPSPNIYISSESSGHSGRAQKVFYARVLFLFSTWGLRGSRMDDPAQGASVAWAFRRTSRDTRACSDAAHTEEATVAMPERSDSSRCTKRSHPIMPVMRSWSLPLYFYEYLSE